MMKDPIKMCEKVFPAIPTIDINVLSDENTFNRPANGCLRDLVSMCLSDANFAALGREGGAAIIHRLFALAMQSTLMVPVLDVLASMTCPVFDIVNRENGEHYMTVSMLPTMEANNRFMSIKLSGIPVMYFTAPDFTELTGTKLAQLTFFILAPIVMGKNEEYMDDLVYQIANSPEHVIDFRNMDEKEGVFGYND